jgi:hypothetical protein
MRYNDSFTLDAYQQLNEAIASLPCRLHHTCFLQLLIREISEVLTHNARLLHVRGIRARSVAPFSLGTFQLPPKCMER